MSATDEELRFVSEELEMDHVTYALIMFRYVSLPSHAHSARAAHTPSRAAHRGVLGERVGHGEELRDRVPHDRPRVAPDGRGGAAAQVARVRGAALCAEPVRRADEPAPADPEGVRRAQDLYVPPAPCPLPSRCARGVLIVSRAPCPVQSARRCSR